MKRLLGFLLVVTLMQAAVAQAQRKASPTPTTATSNAPAATKAGPCGPDYYRNVNGICVHRPVQAQGPMPPKGATAQCRDGSYSFSQHRRGTCNHHGGVVKWL